MFPPACGFFCWRRVDAADRFLPYSETVLAEHRSRDILWRDCGSLAQGTEPIFYGMAAPSLKPSSKMSFSQRGLATWQRPTSRLSPGTKITVAF
jgi:hypothetical protein